MANSRFDQRKTYEEGEANAIGTEYLRADLLRSTDGANVRGPLRDYLDQRISFYETRNVNVLRQMMPPRLNCRPNYGPRSRFRPSGSRRELSRWSFQA